MKNKNLTEQLFIVFIIIVCIMIISLGVILPNNLIPIYESNVYNYLKEPLKFVSTETDLEENITSEIAYIYISSNNISVSENLYNIVGTNKINSIINKIDLTQNEGKAIIKRNKYYYVTSKGNGIIRVALTNDSYITNMKQDILLIIFRVIGISFILISFFIIWWSNNLVTRIKKIKEKIDNINNNSYNHEANSLYTDELYTLDRAVCDMHNYLTQEEQYKNQMYQNISHDFKTPITVMKSYIEAYEDGVNNDTDTLRVLKEQLDKLEMKVHSLLYLNKLNYLMEQNKSLSEVYDVSIVVNEAVEKFKMVRPDVNFIVSIDKKHSTFRGTHASWEAIIDNILNNFTRYAKKEIKIIVKNNKIILSNDGENIDDKVLNNIFTPYEKGLKGVFGLGLSIVKKTLQLLDYDITIENLKNGVKFTIK